MSDMINNPPHYTKGGIETIDFIEAKGMTYHEGNVIKYVVRWKDKGGIEDLHKALWYLQRMIEINQPKNGWSDPKWRADEDDWANSHVPLNIHGHPWTAVPSGDGSVTVTPTGMGRLPEPFPRNYPYTKGGSIDPCKGAECICSKR